MLALCPYLSRSYYLAASVADTDAQRRRCQSLSEPFRARPPERVGGKPRSQPPRVGGSSLSESSSTSSPPSRSSPALPRIPDRSEEEEAEQEEEETASANEKAVDIHACCCVGRDGGGPVWTAARLHGSPGALYAGLFDPIGGPECARAVAALSADYAAAAELSPYQRRLRLDFGRRPSPPLASPIGGVGADGRYFLPGDLRAEHAEAVGRLLRAADDWWPAGGPTERLGAALHRLDADLCSAALPSNDPCSVPAEWARPLARTGAVGCALVLAGRHLRLAQAGDCATVIGSLPAGGQADQWEARQPLAAHTIDNWREVLRVVRQHPDAAERGALFSGDRLLGELEPLRAFGRVCLKWPAALLGGLTGGRPPPRHYRTPPYLTGEPEVLDVPLAPGTDRLVLLGTAALWRAVEPEEAVRCVGRRLLASEGEGEGEGESGSCNLASELVQLARRSRSSLTSSCSSSSSSSSSSSFCCDGSGGGGGGGSGRLAAVVVRLPAELRGDCEGHGDGDVEDEDDDDTDDAGAAGVCDGDCGGGDW